MTCFGNVLYTD